MVGRTTVLGNLVATKMSVAEKEMGNMGKYTLLEIIDKSIGKVEPVGEHNVDRNRLKNLKELHELIDELINLLMRIESDSSYANSYEASVQEIYTTNHEWLIDLVGNIEMMMNMSKEN